MVSIKEEANTTLRVESISCVMAVDLKRFPKNFTLNMLLLQIALKPQVEYQSREQFSLGNREKEIQAH